MSFRGTMSLGTKAMLISLASAAMVIAGCGGDDDAADTTSTTESSTETTEFDAGDSSSDTTDEVAGSEGSFSSEDCEQLASAFDQFDVSESLDGSTDPTAQLKEVAGQLRAAADDAPDAVAADVRILADVYAELADASADIDWEGLQSGDPSAAAGAARLGQIYASNPDFLTAAQSLSEWAQENCVPTS